MDNIKSRKILGVRVDFGFTMNSLLLKIEDLLKSTENTPKLICTTNAEFIMDAQNDSEFRDIINSSALSIPDGIGVLFSNYYLSKTSNISNPLLKFFWGSFFGLFSFFKNFNVGDKISGVNLAWKLMELSNEKSYSIFLLGGRPKDFWGNPLDPIPFDLATVAAGAIRKRYPNVNIIGATSSYSRDINDDGSTIQYIQDCMKNHNIKTLDILLVAYNHKYQEKWFIRNASKIPVKLGIGVGGTFDYMSGYLDHPNSFKFEWLKKIFLRPSKISRILKSFPLFPLKVFIDSVYQGKNNVI